MDYHHHARLTIHSREQLAKKVLAGEAELERGCSRVQAQPAVGRQVGHAASAKAARPLCRTAPRVRIAPPARPPPNWLRRVEMLRRERWTGVRIAQATGLSRATVSRILTRLNLNTARSAGAHRSHRSLRASRSRRSAAHRHQKAGPHRQTRPSHHRQSPGRNPRRRLGVPLRRHRRSLPHRFHRHAPGRKSRFRQQIPAPSRGLLRPLRHHRCAACMTDNGPCFCSRRFAANLPRSAQLTPISHAHLHPAHQRQSRTLYPNRHPRMGLRPALPKLRRAPQLSRSLDPPVQLASTSC